MIIKSLSVGGYRNLAKTSVELGGIIALVSPNNYGKSNFIEALRFAAEFMHASPRTRTAMMSADQLVPLTPVLENENFFFEMTVFNPALNEEYRHIRYGFEFEWMRDEAGGRRIVNEKIDVGAKGGRLTTYLKRREGRYKKSYETRSFRKISLDDNQLAIDVLTAIENIDINPVIRSIRQATIVMLSSIDARDSFESVPIEFTLPADSSRGEDLPAALNRLRECCPKKYEDFLAAVYSLFPEFSSVSLQSYEMRQTERDALAKIIDEGDNVPFRLKDELFRLVVKSDYLNQPVSITRMSTGTQRIVWLVAYTVMANMDGADCIGIEEIETSIHPKMLKELLETLEDSRGKASILLTSHSPYLIQYLRPENIYVGVPSNNGVAQFKRIKAGRVSKARDAAYNRGMGLGEYLFELMSSGAGGSSALRQWLED